MPEARNVDTFFDFHFLGSFALLHIMFTSIFYLIRFYVFFCRYFQNTLISQVSNLHQRAMRRHWICAMVSTIVVIIRMRSDVNVQGINRSNVIVIGLTKVVERAGGGA